MARNEKPFDKFAITIRNIGGSGHSTVTVEGTNLQVTSRGELLVIGKRYDVLLALNGGVWLQATRLTTKVSE